jgi:hypothetical protein
MRAATLVRDSSSYIGINAERLGFFANSKGRY